MSTRVNVSVPSDWNICARPVLAAITAFPGQRLNPLRHSFVADLVADYIQNQTAMNLRDEFHATSEEGAKYVGLFEINNSPSDIDWLICATNANDGTGAFDLHSGICIPALGHTIAFADSRTVLKKYGYVSNDEITSLVNENLKYSHDVFKVELDRMECYKNYALSQAGAHDIICRVITKEIVAGRLSAELITRWHEPFDYIKPRNLWSLFVLCAWFLNRLKTPQLVERTIELHGFFDSLAAFNIKPTTWVQTRFA